MLRDERYGSTDFHQIRTELGLINGRGREIGVLFALHTNRAFHDSIHHRTVDQYLMYYRVHGRQGGEVRLYGGFNDTDKGILGANLMLPVHDCWSIQNSFAYLIPDSSGSAGAQDETWNLSMTLVWHLGCRARKCHRSIYRPLFDVADNGWLMIDDRR